LENFNNLTGEPRVIIITMGLPDKRSISYGSVCSGINLKSTNVNYRYVLDHSCQIRIMPRSK
jgi:hypothetical protein